MWHRRRLSDTESAAVHTFREQEGHSDRAGLGNRCVTGLHEAGTHVGYEGVRPFKERLPGRHSRQRDATLRQAKKGERHYN
ncbi:uncharacterized protein MEPE_04264 [Melanopsichium pennsylvanicum]|uniref:Uncharacterized protein n=1 Tax=Melanopsichium pennsylvanicum TaxID=63383 RepID=A0AAJ4XNJ0_9BASI|nr:uncharacterized protein MEPE_04264 [Melanopsichium pennsylvanicum]